MVAARASQFAAKEQGSPSCSRASKMNSNVFPILSKLAPNQASNLLSGCDAHGNSGHASRSGSHTHIAVAWFGCAF
jgi:hypothetical protein